MTQAEKRLFLIRTLLSENLNYRESDIPADEINQKLLLRGLMNIRNAQPIKSDFLKIQDEYLQAEIAAKGITDIAELTAIEPGLYLWQGDITTLKCDAVVNAANNKMLGCFCPNHKCIDNAIHTFAGIQLRSVCNEIMKKQNCDEPTGQAKITPAFNLPCKNIIHTVGPIVRGKLTEEDRRLLRSCYLSCLELADKNGLHSIAFCCISTGEFHFPNSAAAQIAVDTVKDYKKKSKIEVIFNVFNDEDYAIYKELLTKY